LARFMAFFKIFQGSQQNSGLWNPWLPGWMIDCRLLICLPDVCLIFVGNDFCMSMLLGPIYIYMRLLWAFHVPFSEWNYKFFHSNGFRNIAIWEDCSMWGPLDSKVGL
jgi:hypothetical protein